MAVRNIVKEGDEVLRKISRPVTSFTEKTWTLLDDMAETMYQADGVGLAAPQVGVLRRIVVIDVGEGLLELINPVIVLRRGVQEGQEGCLSCPGEFGIVDRPLYVEAEAQDRNGKPIRVSGEGLLARAICHEVDHLEGIIFKDKAKHMLDTEELKKHQEQ